MYIGKAASGARARRGLRTRLDEYRRFGASEPIGHWGGRYVWQLSDHEDLVVAWRAAGAPDTKETALIGACEARFGGMPFANLRHAARNKVPGTESLKIVNDRMLPYWFSDITADLRDGNTVLVAALGYSLRS